MLLLLSLLCTVIATTSVTITEPVDGEIYDGDWLTVRAIVENENALPDSVHYTLNGESMNQIPRLNTDWPTYMQNNLNHGYSESPAPTNNTLFWSAPITGTWHEFPTPVVVDGLVYYPQNIGGDTLFALDAATGDVEWMYTGVGFADDAVTVSDGRVYTASGSIFCFDAITGTLLWTFGGADWSGNTPTVANGSVFCGASDFQQYGSTIYSLNSLSGEVNWSVVINGETASCFAVWDNKVLIPTYVNVVGGPSLHALNADDGSILWQNSEFERGFWDSSPVVVDGVIYINDAIERSVAIDAYTGEIIWEQPTGGGTSTMAYHDGKLYFGTETSSSYYKLDALSGFSDWVVPYAQHGSTAMADGLIFFGDYFFNDSAKVVALDCNTGETVWTYKTTANRFQGSPSVVDGIVYIPAIDGNLYAFGTGLKYTYLDDLYAQVGLNELIVTSFDGGVVTADTISFTVTGTGINLDPSRVYDLAATPNPFVTTSSISFELSEAGFTSVQIFDLSGRIESLFFCEFIKVV